MSMRLLYWYTRFLDQKGNLQKYHGLGDFELNFSTDTKYHFDAEKYELSEHSYQTPLPERFWGDPPLYNVNAVIGKNGEGKTTVIHTVMNTLQGLFDRKLTTSNETVFIVESKKEKILFHLMGSNKKSAEKTIKCSFKSKNICSDNIKEYDEFLQIIDKTRLIYLTNTLSKADDERFDSVEKHSHVRANFIYDCSLNGAIRYNMRDSIESDNFRKHREQLKEYEQKLSPTEVLDLLDQEPDLLKTYFVNEYYKHVKFVFNSTQYSIISKLKNKGLPVPVPKQLSITVRNPQNHLKHFSFTQGVKALEKISDKIVYRLCEACIYSFISSTVGSFSAIEWFFPPSASCESWQNILDAVFRYNGNSIEQYNWWNQRREECKKFIEFVYHSEFRNILDEFVQPEIDLDALDNDLTFTFIMPVNLQNNWGMIDFFDKYIYSCGRDYFLDFSWGLSSGENNLLGLFSSIFYIFNTNGEHLHTWRNRTNKNIETIPCDSIILFMDEADLTYHPEWQRQLIKILTAFLPLEFNKKNGFKDIQAVLTTHSPLLLSDMPSNNVTYLSMSPTKGENSAENNTFGQNIHTILKNGFFLDGTVGAFATDKINETATKLRNETITPEELEECKTIIDLVAPGILKNKLMELYIAAVPEDKKLMESMKSDAEKLNYDDLNSLIEILQTEQKKRREKS